METLANPEHLEKVMMQLGRSLVTRFFVLFKTAQNYREGHAAIAPPARQLLDVIHNLQRLNAEASLRLKGGYLILGDLRLKPDAAGFEAFRFLMVEMRNRSVGGVTFTPAVTDADIVRFLYIFLGVQSTATSTESYAEIQRLMAESAITGIELEIMTDTTDYSLQEDEARMDSKSRARRIYSQAITAVDDIMGSAHKGKPLRMARAKRVVQGMVDQLLADPTDLVGFTTLKCTQRYTAIHPVNVCILAILTGLRAGFTKLSCCDLGLAALCHDIGKTLLGQELLDKEAELSPEEWQAMRKHPLVGVRLLMELKLFDTLGAQMIAAAFQHHLRHDNSGYPRLQYRKMGTFARIIAIADDYDALTSSRVYSREPHAPEKVIRFMLSRAGRNYDPVLLKLFLHAVGIYPVGTLLLLDSKELAVVVRNKPAVEALTAPWVKVIATPRGEETDGDIVDTAGRAILGTIDTVSLGVVVNGYFI